MNDHPPPPLTALPSPTDLTEDQEQTEDSPEELAVRGIVDTVGVSEKTVRRWIRAGHVGSRLVPGPYGTERRVSVADAQRLASVKGVGHDRPSARAAEASEQLVTMAALWDRSMDRAADRYGEIAAELNRANEARVYAETRIKMMERYDGELQEELDEMTAELDGWKQRALSAEEELSALRIRHSSRRLRLWRRR